MHAPSSESIVRHGASIGIAELFIDANLGVHNVDT
jgi:hypothetical protein